MPSSVIKFFKYNKAEQILTIGFVSGAQYQYRDVPAKLYEEFKRASSKGNFFSRKIRNTYPYIRI